DGTYTVTSLTPGAQITIDHPIPLASAALWRTAGLACPVPSRKEAGHTAYLIVEASGLPRQFGFGEAPLRRPVHRSVANGDSQPAPRAFATFRRNQRPVPRAGK